jgi:hypothetical protein
MNKIVEMIVFPDSFLRHLKCPLYAVRENEGKKRQRNKVVSLVHSLGVLLQAIKCMGHCLVKLGWR